MAVLFFARAVVAGAQKKSMTPSTGESLGHAKGEKSVLELKLFLVDRAGLFPCADDPPAELATERERAAREFSAIQKDKLTFRAVVASVGLGRVTRFTGDDRLLVHCYYTKLQAIHLEPEGDKFKVTIDDGKRGQAAGGATYIDRYGRMMTVESSSAQAGVSRPLRELNSQSDSPLPPPAAGPPKLLEIETRQRLLRHYGRVSACDPMNPVRSGEGFEALERGDPEAIAAVRRQLGITEPNTLSEEQKQKVYSWYLELQSIRLEKLVSGHYFALTLPSRAVGSMGIRVEGIFDVRGAVRELRHTHVAGLCPK
jgi:hypothetical protein